MVIVDENFEEGREDEGDGEGYSLNSSF